MRIKFLRNSGFTLLELLLVIVIIGLLVSYVGPRYFGQLGKSEVETARAQLDSISKAIDLYRLDTGRYPSQEIGLSGLVVAPSGVKNWNGPYLKKDLPLDPWGNPYQYKTPGRNSEFEVYSFGKDGKPGGSQNEEDIYA